MIAIYKSDEGKFIVREAFLALCKIKDKKTVNLFANILGKDKDFQVRAQAAKTLGEIQDKKAMKALNKALLKDGSEEVRKAAKEALDPIPVEATAF